MILISKCCCGVKSRYRHMGYFRKFVAQLGEEHDFVAFCPETAGGLPIPREGCSVIDDRIIGRRTGKDYTFEYTRGAVKALELCQKLDIKQAYLLKNSPSCGRAYGVTAKLLEEHGVEVIPV